MMDSESMIREGYTPMDKECNHCEMGEYWSNSYEIVCVNCALTYRKNDLKKNYGNNDFYGNRPRDRDGKIIPQGHFKSAYQDWNPKE